MVFIKSRIQRRITRYFLLIFLVPTIGLAIFIYDYGSDTLQNTASNQLKSIITLKKQAIINWIEEEKKFLEVLIETPIVKEKSTILLSSDKNENDKKLAYQQLSQYLNRVITRVPDLISLSVLNNIGGRTILSTNVEEEGKYHLSDSFFTRGKKKTYVQRIFYSEKHEVPLSIIASPLKNNEGKIIGVMYAQINPDFFLRIANEWEGLGDTGETYLVDIKNRMVTKSRFDNQVTITDINSHGIEAALERKNISGQFLNYRGEAVVGYYHWLNEPKVVLAAEISLKEALEPLHQFTLILFVVMIVVLIGTTVLAMLFARRITLPILGLSKVVKKVAEGDLNQRATIKTNDELEDLSGAFNRMTTQLSALYKNLVVEKNKAESANIAKSEFLSNMSHELRTPMHSILSFCRFGIKKISTEPTEKIVEYFSKIETSAERLLTLLNDLLDLSKLEAGSQELDIQLHSLGTITTEVIDEFQTQLLDRNLKISVINPPDSKPVYCDIDKIGQVIRNLISNAIKYSPQGKDIEITLSEWDKSIKFSIEDGGIGIPNGEFKTVFDKFVQSSHTNTGAGGTGLGLAICKEIIELHHGTIAVEKSVLGGAHFWFTLPVKE